LVLGKKKRDTLPLGKYSGAGKPRTKFKTRMKRNCNKVWVVANTAKENVTKEA